MNFIGHKRQFDYLNKTLRKDSLSHAYLFYGPEGVGKFTLAKILSQTLYCEQADLDMRRICGACTTCRQIENLSHPNLIVLDLERTLVSKKEKKKEIPIEDIRELKRVFSLAPEADHWRIAIIRQADKMSLEAANSLLKLLEEPGENTLLVLISPDRDILLETLVSRTQTIAFSLVAAKEMTAVLQERKLGEEIEKRILLISAGRPGVIKTLLEQKNLLSEEEKFLKDLTKIFQQKKLPEAFLFNESVAGDENLKNKTVAYIIKMLRRAVLDEPDQTKKLKLVGKIKKIDKIVNILDTTNVNPRLALDAIFIEAQIDF